MNALIISMIKAVSLVIAVAVFIVIVQQILRYSEKQKLAKLGIADIDRLSGRDF
ncbi:MAG: hypothetical protein ACYC69_17170 [Thermodesulfovibrionales bacterium]